MKEDAERQAFEIIVSGPPYEYDIEKWPNEEDRFSWPGGYKDIAVQLAWDMWLERSKLDEKFMTIVDELMMFLWNNISADGVGGNIDISAAETHAGSLAELMTAVKKHLEK